MVNARLSLLLFLLPFSTYTMHTVTLQQDSQNIKIHTFSPPRTLSTVWLRTVEGLGYCAIMNEPTQSPYNLKRSTIPLDHCFHEGTPKTYKEVREKIDELAQKRNVFIKDISPAALEFLQENPDYSCNSQCYFSFLVRNPHAVIVSLYKKLEPKNFESMFRAPGTKYSFSHAIGYKALCELYKIIEEKNPHGVHLIKSEDLCASPEKTLQDFCTFCSIPYKSEAVHWQDLGPDFSGKVEWNETKVPFLIHNWHDKALHSTGFTEMTLYDVDEAGQPTFNEISDEEHRKDCIEAYKENLIYYNELLDRYNK